MFKNFDDQFVAPDREKSHTTRLNIHALMVDNESGHVLGLQKNSIHQQNNPLLRAEQLTLKEAVETKNRLSPRNPVTISAERYYRNLLFNDCNSYDALKTGATIYTTFFACGRCCHRTSFCPHCVKHESAQRISAIVGVLHQRSNQSSS